MPSDLEIRAHSNSRFLAIGWETSINSLGMDNIVELSENRREKHESSSGAEHPLSQRLTRRRIVDEQRPVPSMVGILYRASQQARLGYDEGYPDQTRPFQTNDCKLEISQGLKRIIVILQFTPWLIANCIPAGDEEEESTGT